MLRWSTLLPHALPCGTPTLRQCRVQRPADGTHSPPRPSTHARTPRRQGEEAGLTAAALKKARRQKPKLTLELLKQPGGLPDVFCTFPEALRTQARAHSGGQQSGAGAVTASETRSPAVAAADCAAGADARPCRPPPTSSRARGTRQETCAACWRCTSAGRHAFHCCRICCCCCRRGRPWGSPCMALCRKSPRRRVAHCCPPPPPRPRAVQERVFPSATFDGFISDVERLSGTHAVKAELYDMRAQLQAVSGRWAASRAADVGVRVGGRGSRGAHSRGCDCQWRVRGDLVSTHSRALTCMRACARAGLALGGAAPRAGLGRAGRRGGG